MRVAVDPATIVAVIDFRRKGLVLQWHLLGGTWTAYDNPPTLAHGIAFIRPTGPNICVFAQNGQLTLQIANEHYAFTGAAPRLRFSRSLTGLGFRRRFSVLSEAGVVLFSDSYWSNQRHDFFRWLAAKASIPDWRAECARRWSVGLPAAELRG